MPLAVSNSSVAPGTLGFLVVAGMAVLLVLLFRSMSKHLRKVNDQARRDQKATPPGPTPASPTPASPTPASTAPASPAPASTAADRGPGNGGRPS